MDDLLRGYLGEIMRKEGHKKEDRLWVVPATTVPELVKALLGPYGKKGHTVMLSFTAKI